MFKYIYQPTDLSESSKIAFEVASFIAKKNEGEIHFVHVYDKPYYSVTNVAGNLSYAVDNESLKDLNHEVKTKLMNFKAMECAQGVPLYKVMLADTNLHQFYEKIDLKKADLVVMSTKGATGFFHGGIFGTNTEKMIQHCPIPVLSVPASFEFKGGVKEIMFATDFKDDLSTSYPKVVEMAKTFGAKIYVAVINTAQNMTTVNKAQDEFELLTAKYRYDNVELVIQNDSDVERGIATLAKIYGIDLVAMITHGRTGISHFFKGSIAEELSAHLPIPLLTFHAQ